MPRVVAWGECEGQDQRAREDADHQAVSTDVNVMHRGAGRSGCHRGYAHNE